MSHPPVVFLSPDNPEAAKAFADLLRSLAETQPILGLVVKVHDDQVVNWEFADATQLRAMALVLPEPQTTSKE